MAQPSLPPAEPAVIYAVPRWDPAWAVPEVPVPESDMHDAAIEWLRGLLLAWVERSGRDIKVVRNLGIRWMPEEPRAGFDPDLCVLEPSPPTDEPLPSLRLWQPKHAAPLLAIEVVSQGHPYKDYVDTPERCAACGVRELWVYDPMLVGPAARGGPHLLQVWQRTDSGRFERTEAGSEAAFSPTLQAWLHPQRSRLPAGARLHVSHDAAGRDRWLSAEQQARIGEQQARHEAQQARVGEQQARDEAQQARDEAQQARALLERERQQRDALERELDLLRKEHDGERRSR